MTERQRLIATIEAAIQDADPGTFIAHKTALAALLAIEASGAAVVPTDPTVGMFRELTLRFKDDPQLHYTFGAWALGSFSDDYRSMLSASPYTLNPPVDAESE